MRKSYASFWTARFLNKHLAKFRFKLDDIKCVLAYFHPNCYMVKLDLRSGYHHVDIHPMFHQYLGFSWNFKGQQTYFTFTVLPFGISSGPFLFTKLMRIWVQKWRSSGINVVIYLDDLIVIGHSFSKCDHNLSTIMSDLDKAGFVISVKKSVLTPKQELSFLGFILNSESYGIAIPQAKVVKIMGLLESALSSHLLPARKVLQIAGSIIALRYVLGDLCLLQTRDLYRFVGSCSDFDSLYPANSRVHDCFKFWHRYLQQPSHCFRSLTPVSNNRSFVVK